MIIICRIMCSLITLFFIWSSAEAENISPTFTNDDLKHNKSSNNRNTTGDTMKFKSSERKSAARNKKAEGDNKEKWCRKGMLYRNRVDDAKRNLEYIELKHKEAESEKSNIKKYRKKTASSETALRKARLKLEKAERALNDLEQEAHRKNIPPGWLRCQFSY